MAERTPAGRPRVGVVTFPGSCDDRDALRAAGICGAEGVSIWHGDAVLPDVDAIVVPGGFSYGDYLRPGALARFSPAMAAIRSFAEAGGPVLGICNGFQILCEAGLLPGVLTPNHGGRFVCRDVELRVERPSPWTGDRASGDVLRVPVKHHDGAWYAPEPERRRLEAAGQVLLRYVDDVNGAADAVAGVTNERGNVFGLMPHPEHAVEALLGGTDGRLIFAGLVRAATARAA